MVPEHWQQVADDLRRLVAQIETAGRPDLEPWAKGFARAANSYRAAIGQDGATSLRIDAVCRALDLRTPKSALKTFVGAPP
jgi:hypothetical protein